MIKVGKFASLKSIAVAGSLALAVTTGVVVNAQDNAAPAAAAASTAKSYKVDGGHSSVVFNILRPSGAKFYGRFNEVDGTVTWDAADTSKSTVSVTIKTESIDTNNEKRDQHLKSPDFFNAKEFPTITFASTSIKKVDDKNYTMTGNLTMSGITKEITSNFEITGQGTMRGKAVIGAEATFTIKRSEFGITYMPDGLSEEVNLIVALEVAG